MTVRAGEPSPERAGGGGARHPAAGVPAVRGSADQAGYEWGQVSWYSEMFLSLRGAGHRNCS
ncbi:hypothetical protein Aros01_07657 [Streptosporangium roseum]